MCIHPLAMPPGPPRNQAAKGMAPRTVKIPGICNDRGPLLEIVQGCHDGGLMQTRPVAIVSTRHVTR